MWYPGVIVQEQVFLPIWYRIVQPAREEPSDQPGIKINLILMSSIRSYQVMPHRRPSLHVCNFHMDSMFNRVIPIYLHILFYVEQSNLISHPLELLSTISCINWGRHA